MVRVLALVAFAFACLPAPAATAHGPSLRAATPLIVDEQGPVLVQLSSGPVRRDGVSFRFVCPALWGGDETTPLGFVPGGHAWVGSSAGLYQLDATGRVRPHPHTESGRVLALAGSSELLLALRDLGDRREVLRIEPQGSTTLWTGPERWTALGVSETVVLLLALRGGQLSQLTLLLDGRELSRALAQVPASTVTAEARPIGDVDYIVLGDDAGGAALGRIEHGQFRELARGQGNLSGPIETGTGGLLLAVDGALAPFSDERVAPSIEADTVLGLGRFGDRRFAVVRDGLRELNNDQLGRPLFALGSVIEPDLFSVPEAARTTCDAQWKHLQFELVAAGFAIAPSAGAARAASDAAVLPSSANSADSGMAAATPAPRSGGCALKETHAARPAAKHAVFASTPAVCAYLSVLLAARLILRARRKPGKYALPS